MHFYNNNRLSNMRSCLPECFSAVYFIIKVSQVLTFIKKNFHIPRYFFLTFFVSYDKEKNLMKFNFQTTFVPYTGIQCSFHPYCRLWFNLAYFIYEAVKVHNNFSNYLDMWRNLHKIYILSRKCQTRTCFKK